MDELAHLATDPSLVAPLIEHLEHGFSIMDNSHKFKTWNIANTKILGKGLLSDLTPEQWPAYYGLHCPIEQRLLHWYELPLILAMEQRQQIEKEIVLINDSIPQGRWLKVWASPLFNAQQELLGSAAIMHNITDQKASLQVSQMMTQFFSASDDAIIGINSEGIILLWNPGAECLLGWSAEEMVGHSVLRLLPPGRHHEIIRLIQKSKSQSPLPPLETNILHKNGDMISVSRSITLMPTPYSGPIRGVVVARDISRLKQAELQLEKSQQQLRLLSVRQQNLLEQQLRALARELHDEFGQQLAAMKFELAWLERHLEANSDIEERLESLNNLLNSTIAGLRRVSKQMRPPLLEELGLLHALDELISEISGRYNFNTRYDCHLSHMNFNNEAALAIYRIIQEALTNVVRHSQAHNVTVILTQEDTRMIALVTDDGCGLPSVPKIQGANFGILGMQERARSWAGEVTVSTQENGGTQVRAEFPWNKILASD